MFNQLYLFCITTLFFLNIMLPEGVMAQHGKIVIDSLKSASISNTITNENAVRKVAVYLPPNYAKTKKNYPVIYLLHGVGDDYETFIADAKPYQNIRNLMDKGLAKKKFGEMIIVMPDEKTTWFGSFYSNSSVTGNWEDFTVKELVGFIDSKYRTIAKSSSRAIAGHSMGGYGALTLAMKHPEIYSAVYAMNSALICFCGEIDPKNEDFRFFTQTSGQETLLKSERYVSMGLLAVSRAFSPNRGKPPLYIDKPFNLINGKMVKDDSIYRKWQEKDPVNMAVKFKKNLLKLKGIKFDSGSGDDSPFIVENNRRLNRQLHALHIPHGFEEYNGDHSNKLWGLHGRIYTKMLPFIYQLIQGH